MVEIVTYGILIESYEMTPDDRPPPDIRDDEEKADVARILAALPADDPARRAHERGVDTIGLTHMVGYQNLSKALTAAFLAGWNRLLRRGQRFRP
jgi:hypothetical protein